MRSLINSTMKACVNFLVVSVIALATACNKDNNVDPQIETTDARATSASTILVTGNVIETGTFAIKDYGFAYSLTNYVDTSSTKVSLGATPIKGNFQREIALAPSYYNQNNTVYIRAYLTNMKGTVYGKTLQVSLPMVTVTSVFPMTGKVGDQITITGTNFSSSPANNVVTFNNANATIIEATSTKLVVTVPDGIDLSYYYSYSNINIQVRTFGGSISATQYFSLLPTCTGFSPQSGSFGTLVTLNGKGFFPGLQLKVGGTYASASSVTSTALTFSIPSGVTSASLPITLSLNNTSIDVPGGNFTINPPVINSFSPNIGIGGTLVTISGSNFNIYGNSVKIGTVDATVQSSNNSSITVYVPTSLGLGTYPITVNTGVHSVTAANSFTLSSPQITDFQPQTAVRGTYVTITGANFGSVQYSNSVLFGSTQVSIYSWTDNTIKVQIPSFMSTGTMKITINAGGQSVVSTGSIVIQ